MVEVNESSVKAGGNIILGITIVSGIFLLIGYLIFKSNIKKVRKGLDDAYNSIVQGAKDILNYPAQQLRKYLDYEDEESMLDRNSRIISDAKKWLELNKNIKPSYSDKDYEIAADNLYRAMKGAGTNETIIYNLIKAIKNKADVYKLFVAFGVRKGANKLGADNLIMWLNYELTQAERLNVKRLLSERGIEINLMTKIG